MPIQVRWGNAENTVVVCEFEPKWTLEEYYTMIDDAYTLMISVTHTVHTIADFTNSRMAPSQILTSGRHVQKHSAPNSGITVVVSGGGFIKALLDIAQKLYLTGKKIFVANTIEEAFAIVQKHEKQLA